MLIYYSIFKLLTATWKKAVHDCDSDTKQQLPVIREATHILVDAQNCII